MERLSLTPLLRHITHQHPARTAFRFGGRAWTYAELDGVTDAVAAGLCARGIRDGDRVAFLLPNSPELVFLNLACLKVGAIAVPMNTRMKGPELAYVLNHCHARLGVVHTELYPNLEPVRSELAHVETIFTVGGPPPAGCQPFEALPVDKKADQEWPALGTDDVAAILYTSGTTARPKGVTHTQRTLASTARHFVATVGMTVDDVVFGMLGMSHIFGYTLQLLAPLSVGATVLAAPNFDAASVIDQIARHRVTHLYGLPVMFDALTRQPVGNSSGVRTLRFCLAGGDAVSSRLSASVREALGVELHEGCGMTEVIPLRPQSARPGEPRRLDRAAL